MVRPNSLALLLVLMMVPNRVFRPTVSCRSTWYSTAGPNNGPMKNLTGDGETMSVMGRAIPNAALGQPTSALTTSAPFGTVVPPSRLYRAAGAEMEVVLCANAGKATAAASSATPDSACLVFMGGAPYLRASRSSIPDCPD